MVSTDVNGTTVTTQSNYAMELVTGKWHKIYANLGNVFDVGFNPKCINKIGLQLNYLGSGPATTICQVDTIRITE